ncbi:unnamed protein product [uncultured virus]|nr:unnamed protein product [uncultured virus]
MSERVDHGINTDFTDFPLSRLKGIIDVMLVLSCASRFRGDRR